MAALKWTNVELEKETARICLSEGENIGWVQKMLGMGRFR